MNTKVETNFPAQVRFCGPVLAMYLRAVMYGGDGDDSIAIF